VNQIKKDDLLKLYKDSFDLARDATIPKRLNTTLGVTDYELSPTQPIPDCENFFRQIHVNKYASYDSERSPKLVKKSKNIVGKLIEESSTTPEAAIKTIYLTINLFKN